MKKISAMLIQSYLKILARWIVNKFHPEIIGVTGSIGKTSTKEAIFLILKRYLGRSVGKSSGNLNTKFGLPLAIIGFRRAPNFWQWPIFLLWAPIKVMLTRRYPAVLVLEYAADLPGDISYLTALAPPKIAVVTCVGPAHLQFFRDVEHVAQEKSALVKAVPPDGFAVLNKNDKWSKAMAKLCPGKVIYFESELLSLAVRAAETVGQIFGIPLPKIKDTLNHFQYPPGRLTTYQGPKNSVVIDDSYNANPISMEAALRRLLSLAKQFKKGRRIAILGEMLELGSFTSGAHRDVGELARQFCDLLIGVGDQAREYQADYWFKTAEETAHFVLGEVKKDDIILIKGSNAVGLSKVVERLKRKGT